MAAPAKRQKPIGSKEWIAAEKENVQMLVNQEMEEVEYPARHEMEWLNEHMAEIFRGSSLNVTELFKTPGKMRGKTPRTIRKHQTPRTARAPLSEIFSATRNRSPLPRSHFNQQIERLTTKEKAWSPLSQNQNSNPNYNTDSGYHGMPDDDDMQMIPTEPNTQVDTQMDATQPDTQPEPARKEPTPDENPARRNTRDSFHSAREAASKEPTVEPMQADFEPAEHEHELENKRGEMDFEYTFPPRPEKQPEYPTLPTNERRSSKNDTVHSTIKSPEPGHQVQDELDEHLDDIGSPSENSTPVRPLIRKSSLNFASLPAREPLNTKRSMGGARNSYIDRGFFGRQTGARLTQAVEKNDDKMEEERPEQKSSTQLLHEKINMLGKTQAPRTTKSISANAQSIAYPDLSASRREPSEERIKAREQTPAEALNRPSTSQQLTARKPFESPRPQTSHAERKTPGSIIDGRSPARGMFNPARFWHAKSNSTSSMLGSPPKNAEHVHVDTTPVNSPGRYEGPLSASRGRLQSIMKSAKGLFSSSVGVSTAARPESQSPTANRPVIASQLQRAESRMAQQSPVKPEGRRTRSSTEREQRRKQEEAREKERREQEERERRQREREERERIEREEREERERIEREEREERERLEREREEWERQEREERERIEREERERKEKEEQRIREEEKRREAQKNAPVMQKLDRVQVPVTRINQSSPRKQLKPEEEHKFAMPKPKGRPVKPTRDTAKPKPQPVSIRVGTHSQRMAMSQHQPEPAPSTRLRSTTGNNTSSTSLHTAASSSSFKSNSSTASTKSKTTVAKKKEAEAQRRLEARREAERKKAAEEEARRLEQAEAELRERERAVQEDPKKAAQRQAIEKRRLENARKLEQQQQQQRVQATPSRPRASTMQDRPTYAQREQPSARPASRLQSSQRPINVPMPNPAKPPKRAMDEDSSRIASVKPGVVQQADGKRRKTDEEIEQPVRPTMAPPIRQSGVRKDTIKPPGYGSGYSTMPPQHGQAPSMFRNPSLGPRQYQAPAGQRTGHPLDLSKYASGKIPFAEPPVNQAPVQPVHYSMHNKTPAHAQRPPKSSPAYPNGDAINLPEIPTDSEDSDSDAEPYNVPEWAREENLGRILMDQEGRDGEAVFGPSAPLQMEEIFKDNKERFKRFRDRTSSANWLSTGDGLTAEEVRWDLEQREKLKRNGGWTFNPSSPAPR